MRSRIRPRLSYANVVATIALFVVLGGGAYATIDRKIRASDLRKGAVTTPKIKKRAVKAGKLAPNSVRTPKVFDGAITTPKVLDGAIATPKLGDQAVTGAKLADGAVGTEKLGDQEVTGAKLADGSVTDAKLASPRLFATVAPANVNAQIVRGQGAAEVNRITNGSFRVTFNRSVQECTWLATYGTPGNQLVDAKFATVRGRDPATLPNDVGVVIRDTAGGQVDGLGFHVEVLCP